LIAGATLTLRSTGVGAGSDNACRSAAAPLPAIAKTSRSRRGNCRPNFPCIKGPLPNKIASSLPNVEARLNHNELLCALQFCQNRTTFSGLAFFVEMFGRSLARRMARRPMRPLASWRGSRGANPQGASGMSDRVGKGSAGPTHPKSGVRVTGAATAFHRPTSLRYLLQSLHEQGAREWARSALTAAQAILDPGRSYRGLWKERAAYSPPKRERLGGGLHITHLMSSFSVARLSRSLGRSDLPKQSANCPCSHWLLTRFFLICGAYTALQSIGKTTTLAPIHHWRDPRPDVREVGMGIPPTPDSTNASVSRQKRPERTQRTRSKSNKKTP